MLAHMQVDQEALKAKLKSSPSVASSAGKENGVGSPLGGALKLKQSPFALTPRANSGTLRPALAATTNQLASTKLSTPKPSMDVDMEQEAKMAAMVCSLENKDACLMCGS
jgi:hypothetical protein